MADIQDKSEDIIRDALVNQNAKTVTVLSSLLAVQDSLGYISAKAIERVASHTGSTINEVWGVASFYTNFRFTPPEEHTVEVCWGPTCHLLGAQGILRSFMDKLGLHEEGDSSNARISLKFNTCLGACSQGPVISIDHKIIGPKSLVDGHVSFKDKACELLEELMNGVNK